eukprot:CAMPEP_0170168776 /NCGR_PEP_ID=MMETSP0040_2-20121228/1731_1 /TAXON_ID=641309 /ORGANISM="Lotharella oceanica, Strain CCMP622" /LENGTH=65 /DNA_ID=CAMNT_0010407139 /DNA_START=72 /DNA_END=269 /DNA_ORIENTATION=-
MAMLKYLNPGTAAIGIDSLLTNAMKRSMNVGVTKTVVPTAVGIGTIGVSVEWILCHEAHNVAKYH